MQEKHTKKTSVLGWCCFGLRCKELDEASAACTKVCHRSCRWESGRTSSPISKPCHFSSSIQLPKTSPLWHDWVWNSRCCSSVAELFIQRACTTWKFSSSKFRSSSLLASLQLLKLLCKFVQRTISLPVRSKLRKAPPACWWVWALPPQSVMWSMCKMDRFTTFTCCKQKRDCKSPLWRKSESQWKMRTSQHMLLACSPSDMLQYEEWRRLSC